MNSRPNEAAIDRIVASCNGDIHGALKALLLVNEQLEAELEATLCGGRHWRTVRARHRRAALEPSVSIASKRGSGFLI